MTNDQIADVEVYDAVAQAEAVAKAYQKDEAQKGVVQEAEDVAKAYQQSNEGTAYGFMYHDGAAREIEGVLQQIRDYIQTPNDYKVEVGEVKDLDTAGDENLDAVVEAATKEGMTHVVRTKSASEDNAAAAIENSQILNGVYQEVIGQGNPFYGNVVSKQDKEYKLLVEA
jgi:hypothetical protein